MNGLEALLPGVNGTPAAAPKTSDAKANELGSADRFLKLLVAQMQNQDPLNPLDNAQVTSQLAQINTVNGIENLNGTMRGLSAQVVQLQALQGASLVGRDVTLEGNQLASLNGNAVGGFELAAGADRVMVELIDDRGAVAQALDLGALPPGRHGFEWPQTARVGIDGWTFRVSAQAGGQPLPTAALMLDRVYAVRTVDNQLSLDTVRSGNIPYSAVRAVN
jgi:flagellar basal-body rod modification protein FlgD